MKADRLEVARRVRDIMDKIVASYTINDIIKYIKAEWGLGEVMAYNYIKRAEKNIQIRAKRRERYLIDTQIAKFELWEKDAIERQDARMALDIAKERSKLLGLYAPEKKSHEVSGAVDNKIIVEFVGVDDENGAN